MIEKLEIYLCRNKHLMAGFLVKVKVKPWNYELKT